MFRKSEDRNKETVTNRPAQLICDGGQPADETNYQTFVGTVVQTGGDDDLTILDDGEDTQSVVPGTIVTGIQSDHEIALGDALAVTGPVNDDDRIETTTYTPIEGTFFGWCGECGARNEVENAHTGCQCGGQVIPEEHVETAGLDIPERGVVTDGGEAQ